MARLEDLALDIVVGGLQRQGELALFASCRGQEAAQIGAAASLRNRAPRSFQYRGLAPLIAGREIRVHAEAKIDGDGQQAARCRSETGSDEVKMEATAKW